MLFQSMELMQRRSSSKQSHASKHAFVVFQNEVKVFDVYNVFLKGIFQRDSHELNSI